MFGSANHLRTLVGLHLVDDVAARRADFRKGLAALVARQRASDDAPLEGLAPAELADSARVALEAQLFDDLDFLEPSSAASALYALATALPLGPERRELGRRVLAAMHEGSAATFVTVARLVALSSAKAAETRDVRARIGLVHALPFGAELEPDALATVILARRELLTHYVLEASRGALWDRVLAARIVERAARDALKRGSARTAERRHLFEGEALRATLERLTLDREPLVWRRAASARGMLAPLSQPFADDVERDLASEGSISRLRRGAASLAASLPVRGSAVLSAAEQMLGGPLAERDPGLATAFLHGGAAVHALAPELSEQLQLLCLERGGREAVEALSVVARELPRSSITAKVRSAARVVLQRAHGRRSDDEGHNAHLELICDELGEVAGSADEGLPALIARALDAYLREGAKSATELAREALARSEALVAELEQCGEHPGSHRSEYRLVNALDAAWLESSTLTELLSLASGPAEAALDRQRVALLLTRLSRALLAREREPHSGGDHVAHVTLRMRRLRALLHALDTDVRHEVEKSHAPRARRIEKTALLLRRIERDESSAMDRIVHATLARAIESLVRDEALEPSDVLCAVARHVPTAHGVLALADASMLPELRGMLRALARLMRALELGDTQPQLPGELVGSLGQLLRLLPAEGAPRTESVRACLGHIHDVLECVLSASALRPLAGDDAPLRALAVAIEELGRLSVGVSFRLGVASEAPACTSGHGLRMFAAALERCLDHGARAGLELTWEALGDALRAELPRPFAELVKQVLRTLLRVPVDAPSLPKSRPAPDYTALPAWLPASRMLGDFAVRRALGPEPGVFSFEVVPRAARYDELAPRYVLSVPDYDGHVARALSEREYTRAFMRESEALLALPTDLHLARVVAAEGLGQPLPHIVTERVAGTPLELLIARAQLTSERALALLLGVLRGLHAMHGAGLGHLGLTPSQVMVRPSDADLHGQTVLRGYGLSGRHVRAGCAYAPYGAPEIWRLSGDADRWQPAQADVYAFGCVAYEALMGERLFDGPSDAACIAEHVSHDGVPHRVAVLMQSAATRVLGEWLATCLRRRPEDRAGIEDLMRTLPSLRGLGRLPWPIASAPPGPG